MYRRLEETSDLVLEFQSNVKIQPLDEIRGGSHGRQRTPAEDHRRASSWGEAEWWWERESARWRGVMLRWPKQRFEHHFVIGTNNLFPAGTSSSSSLESVFQCFWRSSVFLLLVLVSVNLFYRTFSFFFFSVQHNCFRPTYFFSSLNACQRLLCPKLFCRTSGIIRKAMKMNSGRSWNRPTCAYYIVIIGLKIDIEFKKKKETSKNIVIWKWIYLIPKFN